MSIQLFIKVAKSQKGKLYRSLMLVIRGQKFYLTFDESVIIKILDCAPSTLDNLKEGEYPLSELLKK